MYSWEIKNRLTEKTLEGNDKVIDSEIYQEIVDSSPQISRVKYNPMTGRFELWTSDNYYFNFRVVPKR